MGRLENKSTIVTGAGGGIGQAAVLEFLAQGANVTAVDLDDAKLAEIKALAQQQGWEITTVVADVSDKDAVVHYVETAIAAYGQVDALFNNAGVEFHGDIVDIDVSQFDREFAINVRSVFLGMQAVLPGMYERKSGAIVNTSSVNGWVGNATNTPYAGTKHAVIGLTKAAAVEAGVYGVRINAICPGMTRTAMLARFGEPAMLENMATHSVPLGRISDPSEQAKVVSFLLSDDASYITGTPVLVDGGLVNALMP